MLLGEKVGLNPVVIVKVISQGVSFSYILKTMQPEHLSAIFSLVASLKRCVGLWRLQEILGGYQWLESQETDSIYDSSSIGSSINAQFLAAFSAAVGKRSLQFFESDESDPEFIDALDSGVVGVLVKSQEVHPLKFFSPLLKE